MQNTSVCPTSWTKVILAILPGLWLVFQRSGILDWLSREVSSAILLLIVLGLVGVSLAVKRRLTIWCLPALGALLWEGWEWMQWLLFDMRYLWREPLNRLYSLSYNLSGVDPALLILLLWGICVIVTAFVLYRVYQKSSVRMPWLAWALLGLLVVVTVILDFSYFWLVYKGLFSLLVLLIPVAMGLHLARRDGLAAGLLVVACEPVWIDMLFNPLHTIHVQAYRSPNAKLELVLFVLSYLPLLCFLIITPIGVLRSRSRRGKEWWLVLPPFLALVSMNIVPGIALQGTPDEYSLVWWLRRSLAVVQLWLPLLLTVILYVRRGRKNTY